VLLVLTKNSKNKENFEHCKSGEEFQLPMYVLRSDDEPLGVFERFAWRKNMVFSSEKEFDECVKKIREDLVWFTSIGV